MRRCFIISAGTFYGLRERPEPGDLVIAADAGYETCLTAGLTPEVVIGDFDSMTRPKTGAEVICLPVEKDDTDTLAAIKVGLERGFREFYLYGATGGKRLDHTVGNFQALYYLRRHGARGWMYGDDFCWTVIENETLTLRREVEWGLVSVFCLGDRAEGVDETGLQYPLSGAVLLPDVAIGVSNHFMEPEAAVSVARGALLVGWEKPPIGT